MSKHFTVKISIFYELMNSKLLKTLSQTKQTSITYTTTPTDLGAVLKKG